MWTIGYGDTGPDVIKGLTLTLAECEARLAKRLLDFENAVHAAVKVAMTQGQFDAFVSLCYNIGTSGFSGSHLVSAFNRGDAADAARQFGRWIHVRKVISPNLVRRRFGEVVRFFQGVSSEHVK